MSDAREQCDQQKREEATLKRLLATPPQPKTKKKIGAKPKKRGRPKTKSPATKPGSPR